MNDVATIVISHGGHDIQQDFWPALDGVSIMLVMQDGSTLTIRRCDWDGQPVVDFLGPDGEQLEVEGVS